MKTFDTYGPAIGLDFDHFNSAYLVTPTAPSFLYSIDYMGTAEFYRQYLSSPTPEYIYTCPGKLLHQSYILFSKEGYQNYTI